MIKEGFEWLRDTVLKETVTVEANGLTYTQQDLSPILPPEFKSPAPLQLETLDGLIEYVEANKDKIKRESATIHIRSHGKINFIGSLDPKNFNTRFTFAVATMSQQSFQFGCYHGLEDFIISLQSLFVQDQTTEDLFSVLGNLANENIIENKDDGLSQSLQIKTGITTKSNVKIKNPLTLRPYRTFREVEQPKSLCIVRFKKNGPDLSCALFESDGGAWQLEAIKNIKTYLSDNIAGIVSVIG